ncbi:MAG: hypothetical protein A2X84_06855 [Desulfuromonadaceae bacterium GWC2_58_13]|nr:MAG: hypothetical protein A2X84_06855 [Desulfuromonadaceae bacterium GWC2_58_13]
MKHILLLGSLLLLVVAGATGAPLEPLPPRSSAGDPAVGGFDRWLGQHLCFNIDFLWFDSIAEGSLSFAAGPRPGTYRAVLEARTLGAAAWLTSDRVQRYVSVMERTTEGPLRALSHESQIIKGRGAKRKDRSKLYLFDHARRQVSYQHGRNGVLGAAERLPMAEGTPPNDILTAFFNFQAGFFGPIVPGGRYRIPTFSRKGMTTIEAEVLLDPLRVRPDFFPAEGMLVKVLLDPEVFETAGGALYIWFDEGRLPARGIVENVIGLGDVFGTLVESSRTKE